jgi:DNA-binding NtrC family response regulator
VAGEWPGNIRELQNVIERSVILSDGPEIGTDHFPKDLTEPRINLSKILQDQPTLDELEKWYILETLKSSSSNKVLTCERLGISTTTLWRKLKQYGVAQESGIEADEVSA